MTLKIKLTEKDMSSKSFALNENTSGTPVPDATDMRFGIVVCEWNSHITEKLLAAAVETLKENGVSETNITVRHVPGSFELIYGCSQLARFGLVDGIIAIGCVIRGDTPHFDYICQGTTQGLAELNASGTNPVVYGLLTVNSEEQAEDRAGGKLGNKGSEFALTAIKMVDYAWQLQK